MTDREFLDNQLELCNKKGWPFFMPSNGVCFNCSRNIIPTLVAKGQNGKAELVTGCPLCCRSYCD